MHDPRTGTNFRRLVIAAIMALLVAACGGTSDTSAGEATGGGDGDGGESSGEPITVGHLTYQTGPFSDVGPFFDCATDFGIGVINENPPLGRPLESIHDDIGTDGESQSARKLIERDNVEILLNPAHEFEAYRDFAEQTVADNNAPLMPSVHGGAIEASIGGTDEVPIFRGAPQDSAQAVAALIQLSNEGAEDVVLLATTIAGSQLQKDAAVRAAEELGMNVVLDLDVQPEQTSYREIVSRIANTDYDAVAMFGVAEDSGVFAKNMAEGGETTTLVFTSESLNPAFPETATMSAIEQHDNVWVAGFTNAEGEAYDTYSDLWTSSECSEFADPQNSYALQYYDLLVVTALAIEQAGSTNVDDWVEAMPEVAEGPGTEITTYEEGIEAIRNGEEIDYTGVTGDYNYTDTGVVEGLFGIYEWTSLEDLELVTEIDGDQVLEIDQQET